MLKRTKQQNGVAETNDCAIERLEPGAEDATALKVDERPVKRDWEFTGPWLHKRINGGAAKLDHERTQATDHYHLPLGHRARAARA